MELVLFLSVTHRRTVFHGVGAVSFCHTQKGCVSWSWCCLFLSHTEGLCVMELVLSLSVTHRRAVCHGVGAVSFCHTHTHTHTHPYDDAAQVPPHPTPPNLSDHHLASACEREVVDLN